MDARIQFYFRSRGKAPSGGGEIKTEQYDNDRQTIKEAIWELVDDHLDYLDERGDEDDSDD